ncbi:MAG: ABC transporter permease [Clostridium sp.]|nr:ABC transporter permease [Clostridium sp.]
MSLFDIVSKNIKKNFSLYALYMFSISFVLMVFFCFISFSLNGVVLEQIFSDNRMVLIAKFIVLVLMAFVLFYMSYSNTFFMQRRMKELGTYTLLGFSRSKMVGLLLMESALMCCIGLIVGILLGGLAHRGIIQLLVEILGLQLGNLEIPFINIQAVQITILFIVGLLIVIFLSNIKFLYSKTLVQLVKIENAVEKQIKVKSTLSVLGIVLLTIGYLIALDIGREKQSIWYTIGFAPMMFVTVFLVVIGTILFISHGLPYIMLKFRNNKKHLYKDINMILIPKFVQRIRTNAKMLIMITLISTVTLCIVGGTLITFYYPKQGFGRIIPAAFEFPIEDDSQLEVVKAKLENTVGNKNIIYKETNLILAKSFSKKLPYEYTLSEGGGFQLIKQSDYNELMQLQGKKELGEQLQHEQCILVKYQHEKENIDKGNIYTVNINENTSIKIKVKDVTLDNPIGFNNAIGILVISDEVYEQVIDQAQSINRVMSIYGEDLRENKESYEALMPLFSKVSRFQSAYSRESEFVAYNSPLLLIITFSTIVFFVATGSILYFNNISASLYDKNIINVLKKLGYQRDKIKLIIRRQTLIFFIIPYIIGGIHSFFALYCFSALMPNLLGGSEAYLMPELLGIMIYSVVYYIYYIVTKNMCYRISFE